MTKIANLETVINEVHRRSAQHYDEIVPVQDLEFDSLSQMWVSGKQVEVLPSAGRLFANRLRVPYTYLYPLILVFCVIGVYTVNQSVTDIWIMAGAGVAGYVLRKANFDVAPLMLGFILAPMLETAFRQTLEMSGGNYAFFVQRPVALALFIVAFLLLLMSIAPSVLNPRKRAQLDKIED